MSKFIVDNKRAKRIEELYDWSNDGKECYSVKFKNVDGTIWVDNKMKIYSLLDKTDEELQAIDMHLIRRNLIWQK